MMLTVDVGRKKSVQALNYSMEKNIPVYLITQKDITVENPAGDDLYKLGCVCKARQILKMPDGSVKALVHGLYRARHTALDTDGEFYTAAVSRLDDQPIKNRPVYIESMIRRIRASFENYLEVSPKMPADIVMTVASSDNLSFLCDYIAFNVPAPFDDKQYVLEQLNVITRAKVLLELLSKEREITEIDNRIGEKTRYRIDESQKDFYLKEQIKVISDELYGDEGAEETDEYHEKANGLVASDEVKAKIHSEINKLSKMPPGAHEATNQRAFIELCLELPWDRERKASVDINRAAKILDRDFYGLKRVKERILEAISVYALAPDVTATKKPISRLMIWAELPPTAARATVPTNRPTIMPSTALYSCWMQVPAAIGRKKTSSFFQTVPSLRFPDDIRCSIRPSILKPPQGEVPQCGSQLRGFPPCGIHRQFKRRGVSPRPPRQDLPGIRPVAVDPPDIAADLGLGEALRLRAAQFVAHAALQPRVHIRAHEDPERAVILQDHVRVPPDDHEVIPHRGDIADNLPLADQDLRTRSGTCDGVGEAVAVCQLEIVPAVVRHGLFHVIRLHAVPLRQRLDDLPVVIIPAQAFRQALPELPAPAAELSADRYDPHPIHSCPFSSC